MYFGRSEKSLKYQIFTIPKRKVGHKDPKEI